MSCGSTHETQVQYLNNVRSGKYGVGSSSCEEGIEKYIIHKHWLLKPMKERVYMKRKLTLLVQ